MAREYFKCFHSYKDKCKKLSDQELGRLFRALMEYSESGTAPDLTGRESIAFDFIADEIDRDKSAYADTCRKNKENGSKGGKRTVAVGSEREREEPKVSETDKVEGIRKKVLKERHSKECPKKIFTPPSVEEVREYCEQRNNNIDPEYFVAYYASQNWIKANGEPVQDWKQTIITWERKEREKVAQTPGRTNKLENLQRLYKELEGQ